MFAELTTNRVQYQWDRMRGIKGYDNDAQFVIHVCRHTFCSRLVQRGVAIDRVQKLAGHKTLSITMRYAHLRSEDLERAIDVLNPTQTAAPKAAVKMRIAQ